MKKLLLMCFFITGCVTTNYTPQTKEGAQCKKACSHSMLACDGNPYVCDKAMKSCLQSCKEMEEMNNDQ